jgi:predicted site-specific integrase-resolvase
MTTAFSAQQSPQHTSSFYTTSGVARRIRKSEATVRRYASDGRLASVITDGGLRVYPADEVERFAREIGQ